MMATTIGPLVFVDVMLVAFVASVIVGAAVSRRWLGLWLSLLLGVAIALARIKYDPDPAALPGLVGYPLMCMGLNRLGAFVRRKIRSRRDKANGAQDTQSPGV